MTAFDLWAWNHPRDRRGRFRRVRRQGRIVARRIGQQWRGRYVPELWPSNKPIEWRTAATKAELLAIIAQDIDRLHPGRDVIASVHVLGTWN